MNNVLGILVLYKCLLEDSLTFTTLQRSLLHANSTLDLIIYDNSPCPSYNRSKFILGQIRITYLSDIENGGVSKAYNFAGRYAKELNKDWILVFDQDTSFPENAIMMYSNTINQNLQNEIVAPILKSEYGFLSPSKYFLFRASLSKKYLLGVNDFKYKTLLNSGLLISMKIFEEVGGYNEKIPLDFSDTEFIARVKKIIKTFYLINVTCNHSISTNDKDKTKVLKRFEFYCDGMHVYARTSKGRVLIYFWSILRTFKLTIQYKDFSFVRIFLKKIF